eukprot:2331598-Pyramimonas_sp.AAC.1
MGAPRCVPGARPIHKPSGASAGASQLRDARQVAPRAPGHRRGPSRRLAVQHDRAPPAHDQDFAA